MPITFYDGQEAKEYCEWKKREGYRVSMEIKGGKYIVYVSENEENGEFVPGGELSKKVDEGFEED